MSEVAQSHVNLKPLVIRFGVVYAIATLVLAVLTSLLDYLWEIDIPSTAINVASTAVAVMVVSQKFVEQQQRVFSQPERKHMTWASLGVSWFVSIMYSVLIAIGLFAFGAGNLVTDGFNHLVNSGMLGVMIGALLVATLIGWLVLYWFYGSFPKSMLKAIEKKKQSV